MLRSFILVISISILPNIIHGQLGPLDIIDKSIQYHDPEGLLKAGKIKLSLLETRPGGSDRLTSVILDTRREYCKITREVDSDVTMMQLKKKKSSFKLNGSSKISDEDKEKHQLNHDRLIFMKNYYRYLWMLPLTLEDPGTIVHPDYEVVNFHGKTSIELKVTYDPQVGTDIWYFYFHPQTYALEGYRFYHDEAANDGEYILLSEITTYNSLRLPKSRAWYTHKEGKYLGTDMLMTVINDY